VNKVAHMDVSCNVRHMTLKLDPSVSHSRSCCDRMRTHATRVRLNLIEVRTTTTVQLNAGPAPIAWHARTHVPNLRPSVVLAT